VGSFVFSFIMMLSTVGGIGGGGVAIPLAMYFFQLSMKPAIAVSSFSIMMTTICRWLFNFNQRHPEKKNCVCIDYGLANVMMPLTLLGSMTGAYIYASFPDLYLQIILTVLMLVLFITSLNKAITIYKKESESTKKTNRNEEISLTKIGIEVSEKNSEDSRNKEEKSGEPNDLSSNIESE